MKSRFAILILPVLLFACAPRVDVQPVLDDFDDYANDLQAVASAEPTQAALQTGQEKRAEAGALAEAGKDKEALPIAEEALADARFAFEMEQMETAARRAERCMREVEQARTKWSESIYILEQTEQFVGRDKPEAKMEPAAGTPDEKVLPATMLQADATFPPGSMDDVGTHWSQWRAAAAERKIAVGDIEAVYRRSVDATAGEKVDDATRAHHIYLAGRAVQTLECRVRTGVSEGVCVAATRRMSEYADAREGALRATLELERTLQADLRRDLDQLRAEARDRQDELYDALSQMQGKFASIHRDARGTIVSLADILFDFNQATLRRDVEFNLVKIATILNQFGEMKVLVEGHTDSIGTEEYNLILSQKRAQAVSDFLISQDVDASRLSAEGYGESRPVADNDTDEGRQKNRRVDLVIQDAP
jgi:outer membrane protein OmpA-like peptidoglycan-associated protein